MLYEVITPIIVFLGIVVIQVHRVGDVPRRRFVGVLADRPSLGRQRRHVGDGRRQ